LNITTTSFRTDDLIYCIAVGSITSKSPEIAACSYDGRLYVYTRSGRLKWSLDWSTDLTYLALADVEGKGQTALLTGSIDGKVRVFSQRGIPIWQKKLKKPIVCLGAGDIDGDGAEEVVVGLENKQVIFLDNDGSEIWSKQFEEPIVATLINDFNADGEIEAIIAKANGTIQLFTSSGKERYQLDIDERITNFAILHTAFEPLFVTGNKSHKLKFWDKNGSLLQTYELTKSTGEINFITSGPLYHSEIDVVILSGKNDSISVIKLALTGEDSKKQRTGPGLEEVNPLTFDQKVIQELILSITNEEQSIELERLDREITKRLNRKVDYNLREIISDMLAKKQLFGELRENKFIRKSPSYTF
jgi:hypothetical protein